MATEASPPRRRPAHRMDAPVRRRYAETDGGGGVRREAAFLRAYTDVASIKEVNRTSQLILGAVGLGQVRGQATLDVDGEHPNNSRGWQGRRGLVEHESRFGHFEGLVVCCFFLRGTSLPSAIPASARLSSPYSRGRLALEGLALSARSAMSSRPFEDGVAILLETRVGVTGGHGGCRL